MKMVGVQDIKMKKPAGNLLYVLLLLSLLFQDLIKVVILIWMATVRDIEMDLDKGLEIVMINYKE